MVFTKGKNHDCVYLRRVRVPPNRPRLGVGVAQDKEEVLQEVVQMRLPR